MRFAIIYRPKHLVPQDQLPEMLKGIGEWMQKHGSRVEGTQFFVGGGGIATIETDDPGELVVLMTENPFTQYSDVEIRPLIDPEAAITVLQEAYS